jgi:hypothetical protein
MTRQTQKDEERFYADEYIRRRGVEGRLCESEHLDFVAQASDLALGVEVVSYGDRKGREVDAAWDVLIDHATEFRERHPDLNRFGADLHFRNYRMPSPRDYEGFCTAIAALLRENADLPPRSAHAPRPERMLRIDPGDVILGRHLSGICVYGVNFYSSWQWPALINGGIGTSDEEMLAAVERKLREYRQPEHISESHLVVYGRGSQRTRIAAPFSAEQLDSFLSLNSALRASSFTAAAILCYRDFYWTRASGWADLPKPS